MLHLTQLSSRRDGSIDSTAWSRGIFRRRGAARAVDAPCFSRLSPPLRSRSFLSFFVGAAFDACERRSAGAKGATREVSQREWALRRRVSADLAGGGEDAARDRAPESRRGSASSARTAGFFAPFLETSSNFSTARRERGEGVSARRGEGEIAFPRAGVVDCFSSGRSNRSRVAARRRRAREAGAAGHALSMSAFVAAFTSPAYFLSIATTSSSPWPVMLTSVCICARAIAAVRVLLLPSCARRNDRSKRRRSRTNVGRATRDAFERVLRSMRLLRSR